MMSSVRPSAKYSWSGIAAHVLERQHRDRRLVRQRQAARPAPQRGRASARRRCAASGVTARRRPPAQRSLLDLADEAEAALVQRADQRLLVAVVADRAPRRADARIERRVGDHPSLPHRLEQLVLADDPVAMPHQIGEHVEDLRLDRHGRAGVPQFLPHQIDLIGAEAENQTCPRSQKPTRPSRLPGDGEHRSTMAAAARRIPRLEISRKSPEKSRPAAAGRSSGRFRSVAR